VLDHPSTCPHGNPIPGSGGEGEALVRLSDAPVGALGELRCVEAEDQELLSYVERLGLLPGAAVEVLGYAPLEGPIDLRVDDAHVSVGLAAAERLLVRLHPSA